MKIGILTFHASFNYGSMLQAWALQTYLTRLGHQVEIINYRSPFQKAYYYKPFDRNSKFAFKPSLKRLFLEPKSLISMNRRWLRFNDFLNNQLNITKEYNSEKALSEANLRYDLVVVGSDQIWNTLAMDSNSTYFAEFLDKKIRKITYAVSVGPYVDKVDIEKIKKGSVGFDKISVREDATKDLFLKHGIGENILTVCDPTLLLKSNDYENLINPKPLVKEPYILLYIPRGVSMNNVIERFKIAQTLSKNLDVPIITERPFYKYQLKGFPEIRIQDAVGPREFLNLVKNAYCTCGSSFHLMAFSILFRKDFYNINGDKDSRTNTLLNRLGLIDRIISQDKKLINAPLHITNYDIVFEKLESFRQQSSDFLQSSLNNY